MMGRVFIYTDGIAKENLVVPISCAAIYVPDDFIYRPPDDVNVYRLSKRTTLALKEQWDTLTIRYALGFNDLIGKYGVYGTANRLKKKVLVQIKARLFLDGVEDYEVIFIERLDTCAPEARLAYAVARFLRTQWFEVYSYSFKGLKLQEHNGNLSKHHLLYFSHYCRLPSFYIWDRALRAARNIHPTPSWAIHELVHYKKIIGDSNGNS